MTAAPVVPVDQMLTVTFDGWQALHLYHQNLFNEDGLVLPMEHLLMRHNNNASFGTCHLVVVMWLLS